MILLNIFFFFLAKQMLDEYRAFILLYKGGLVRFDLADRFTLKRYELAPSTSFFEGGVPTGMVVFNI